MTDEQEIDECDYHSHDETKCTNKEHGIIVAGDLFGPKPTTFISYCKKHEPHARRLAKKHNLPMAEQHIPSTEEEQT
jgi:mannose/fructose-specific phosphotransferase system component IIA